MLKLMFFAGIGGFLGTCSRFLINKLFQNYFNSILPIATFTVNILGCLILGLIFGLLNKAGIVSPKINSLLIVGFCGGFTTFSTFSFEAFNLGINGEVIYSLLYIFASIIIGILALWLGILITK